MANIKVTAGGIFAIVGVGAALLIATRARGATKDSLNLNSPDNVIDNTVEFVTGFSLYDFGTNLGTNIYTLINGDPRG